jgi:hypothetical protein
VDTIGRHPFAAEVLSGTGFRGEVPRRYRVGYDPIDLFGHPPVETPQACLNVCDWNTKFDGDERRSHGGVHIAHDKDHIWARCDDHGFESPHDLRGLRCMGPGADLERVVWLPYSQISEEDVREVGIVVLAGMHERGSDVLPTLALAQERGDLHEVWTRARNQQDVQPVRRLRRHACFVPFGL